MAETMNEENVCSICSLKVGESMTLSPMVPSMCWLKTERLKTGFIGMTFGYGDDFDHLFYMPNYCPECGKKNEYIVAEERMTV